MSYKVLYTLLFLAVSVFFWFWGYGTGTTHVEVPIHDTIIIKKDSILRDSIKLQNQIIKENTYYIEKEYHAKTNFILSSSDSANFAFFTEYIRNYRRTNTDR